MDTVILRFLEGLRCPAADAFFSALSLLGEEGVLAAAGAAAYFLCPQAAGERLLFSLLTCSVYTAGIKGAVHRVRPYAAGCVTRGNGLLLPQGKDAALSFPSGHAAGSASFYLSAALRPSAGAYRLPALPPRPLHAPRKRGLPALPALLLPLAIGCSRLYFGVHYPSDVAAGLAAGLLCALVWHTVFSRFYGARLHAFAAALLPSLFFLLSARAAPALLQTFAPAAGAACGLLLLHCLARGGQAASFPVRLLRLFAAVLLAAACLPAALLLPAGCAFFARFAAAFAAFGAAPLLIGRRRSAPPAHKPPPPPHKPPRPRVKKRRARSNGLTFPA